jgi:hypothetical protein
MIGRNSIRPDEELGRKQRCLYLSRLPKGLHRERTSSSGTANLPKSKMR